MSRDRADWSCPECQSSDVYRKKGATFECRDCGQQIHESVGASADTLERLSERDDAAGDIARTLLETGGVSE